MKKVESRAKVQAFLNTFIPKFDIWGIFFIDRQKNDEAMSALGITPAQREDIIRKIETDDYIETIVDGVSFGDMWVFGKDFSGEELYIKIAIGPPGSGLSAYRSTSLSFRTNTHSRRKKNDTEVRKYDEPVHGWEGC